MSMVKENKRDKSVLVIEDEKLLQKAIKDKLERNGFEVVTAVEVDEALLKLKKIEKVAAVWLDHYLLGDKNGLDFVARLKKEEKWKEIPIFVVSNTASLDKIKTYLELGVKKYYVKAECRIDDVVKEIIKLNS